MNKAIENLNDLIEEIADDQCERSKKLQAIREALQSMQWQPLPSPPTMKETP